MNSSVNIKELVPSFAEDFIELETEIFDRTKYYNYVSKHSKRIGLFSKYLNGKVHDSWIMKSNRLNESFTLELNDFSTHVFADAIIEKKGVKINHDKLIFPLEIKFLSTKDIQFYKIDENGFAFPLQIVEVDEYLYEEILAINEQSLKVAFQFWKNAKSEFKRGERIVAIIEAETIEVKEKQDEAWNELFGNQYDEYYQYYKSQFNSERHVSDYTECLKLVDEFEGNKKRKPTHNM